MAFGLSSSFLFSSIAAAAAVTDARILLMDCSKDTTLGLRGANGAVVASSELWDSSTGSATEYEKYAITTSNLFAWTTDTTEPKSVQAKTGLNYEITVTDGSQAGIKKIDSNGAGSLSYTCTKPQDSSLTAVSDGGRLCTAQFVCEQVSTVAIASKSSGGAIIACGGCGGHDIPQ